MKKKRILIITVASIFAAALVLGALAFCGVRYDFLGLREPLGYRKIEVQVIAEPVGTDNTYTFYTKHDTLRALAEGRRKIGAAFDENGNLTNLAGCDTSAFRNCYTRLYAVSYGDDGQIKLYKEITPDEALDPIYKYILRLGKSSDNIQIGG